MNSLTKPSPLMQAMERAVTSDPRLRSPHSISQYRSHLTKFEAWRDGRAFTLSLVNEYIVGLQRAGYAPETIRQHQAVIRWWARTLSQIAEEQLSPTEAERIVKQAAKILTMRSVETEGQTRERGRHLDKSELAALLNACSRDETPAGPRDRAIIWMAYSNGLRRQTLCDLDMADLERTDYGARIRYTSKRGKKGYAHLMGDAWQAVQEWISVRGMDPGPLFTQVNKSGRVVVLEQPLSGEAIRLWLDKRFLESGLDKAMTWHTFRYTFAGNLLDEGYDISTVQALMLHANPTTTARYDRRKERHQTEAILSISTLEVKNG